MVHRRDDRASPRRTYAIGMAPAAQLLFGLPLVIIHGSDIPVPFGLASHYAGWLVNLAIAERAIWRGQPRPALA